MSLFLLGSALGLCYACVCDTGAGTFAGAGKGERVTELMQKHKQEMTLFGEHVSL